MNCEYRLFSEILKIYGFTVPYIRVFGRTVVRFF